MSCLTSQNFPLKGHRVSLLSKFLPGRKSRTQRSLFCTPLMYSVALLGDAIISVIARMTPRPKLVSCVCVFISICIFRSFNYFQYIFIIVSIKALYIFFVSISRYLIFRGYYFFISFFKCIADR